MEIDLWRKIVDDAAANGHTIEWLHVLGEPLLWPHLIEGICYLSKAGLAAQISTNGLLLTADLARALAEAGQRDILVAIDSLKPDAYEKLRGQNRVEEVVDNVYAALEAAPSLVIRLQFMRSMYNQDETEEDYLRVFGRTPNLIVEPWVAVRWTLDTADAANALDRGENGVDKRLCDKLFERVAVLWDGRTALCCMDAEGELQTGDLNENSITYSFLGPRAMELRRMILRGKWTKFAACCRCSGDHVIVNWDGRESRRSRWGLGLMGWFHCGGGIRGKPWRLTDPPRTLPPPEAKLLRAIEALDGRQFDEREGRWL